MIKIGIHRWDGYIGYRDKAIKTIIYILENFCIGCHRGSFVSECPLQNEQVKCGTYELFKQCMDYLENRLGKEYHDENDEDLAKFLDLADKVINNPWQVIERDENTSFRNFKPIFETTSKFKDLKEIAIKIMNAEKDSPIIKINFEGDKD